MESLKTQVLGRMTEERFIAVIRTETQEEGYLSAARCISAGVGLVEITLTIPGAEELIARLKEEFPGASIGAGTVLCRTQAERALSFGADFIVSPCTDGEVISLCGERGVLVAAGAFTPNEVYRALSLGADFVKIFPASAVGPGYLKELLGPLPQARFMVTGSVNETTIADWLRCGASVVGIGSLLVKPALAGETALLKERVCALQARVRACCGEGK